MAATLVYAASSYVSAWSAAINTVSNEAILIFLFSQSVIFAYLICTYTLMFNCIDHIS